MWWGGRTVFAAVRLALQAGREGNHKGCPIGRGWEASGGGAGAAGALMFALFPLELAALGTGLVPGGRFRRPGCGSRFET